MARAAPGHPLRFDVMPKEFTEKNPFYKRVFELEESMIKIKASGVFGPRYEAEVPLKGIRKQKDTAYVRTDSKTALYGVPGIALMFLAIAFSETIIDISVAAFYASLVASVLIAFIGFIFAKKSKGYVYYFESGAAAFDITESGNRRNEFEDFCSAIEAAIRSQNLRA
jgi:hypothetical protein